MAKYTLKKEPSNPLEISTVEVSFETTTLTTVLEELETFLRASDFDFQVSLDFVDENDE